MARQPTLRPATASDFEAVYGHPPPFSMRALTAVLDGKPVGIGGIAFIGRETQLFSKMLDDLRPFKRFIVRCALIGAGMARETGALAVASKDEPSACKLLQRVGGENIGQAPHGKVFRWAR